MQDGVSTFDWTMRKEVNQITKSSCCDSPGAGISISQDAVSFEHVFGLFTVRERASNSIALVLIFAAGKVLSPENRDAINCGVHHHLGFIEEVSRFAS